MGLKWITCKQECPSPGKLLCNQGRWLWAPGRPATGCWRRCRFSEASKSLPGDGPCL